MRVTGSHSRRKGRRGENELAAILHELGARRISEAGSPGPDLALGSGHVIEVKRRATTDGFSLPERLLNGAAIVALRADKREWLICMRPETLIDIYLGYPE